MEKNLSGTSGSKNDFAKAVYFTGNRSVFIKEEPLHPGQNRHGGQVLVESNVIGISHGTEMLFYRGEIKQGTALDETISDLQRETVYPVKYGYINVGTDETGSKVFAFFPHQDRFYTGKENLIYLSESMDDEDAVFIPNLETALAINHDLPLEPGSAVFVCGLGVVGLLTIEILVRRHYGIIIGTDPVEKRRKAAEDLGAVCFPPTGERLRGFIEEATDGRGVDWAVNTSSSDAGLQLCVDAVCFGGMVIEPSWYGGKKAYLELGGNFHRNRVKIHSVQVSSVNPSLMHRWTKARRMDTVLELVEKITPKKYITHRFPLEEAGTAFALIDSHFDSTIQVILIP